MRKVSIKLHILCKIRQYAIIFSNITCNNYNSVKFLSLVIFIVDSYDKYYNPIGYVKKLATELHACKY